MKLLPTFSLFWRKKNLQNLNLTSYLNNFFSKYDQICSFQRIWSNLLKKAFMENLILCAVATRKLKQNQHYQDLKDIIKNITKSTLNLRKKYVFHCNEHSALNTVK